MSGFAFSSLPDDAISDDEDDVNEFDGEQTGGVEEEVDTLAAIQAEKEKLQQQADEIDKQFKMEAWTREWTRIVFIAPLLPSLFSIAVVVVGGIVLNVSVWTCGYPLHST